MSEIGRGFCVLLVTGFAWSCASSPSPSKSAVPEDAESTVPVVAEIAPATVDPAPPPTHDSEQVAGTPEADLETAIAVQSPGVPAQPLISWPPQGVPKASKWPFYKWDSAQAYTFNLVPYGPGMELEVWTPELGMHPTAIAGPVLTKTQVQDAEENLKMTLGGFDLSKCAFPRHGIVFYADKIPVGSINVCFECGDILIWPAYKQEPNWSDKKIKMHGKLFKMYEKVFPKWKKLFGELGLATDWKKLPTK